MVDLITLAFELLLVLAGVIILLFLPVYTAYFAVRLLYHKLTGTDWPTPRW